MARRPGHLDLSGADRAAGPTIISPRNRMHIDLPSPRAGEVPPALSPLDMFAQQSRMLAKRFEASQLGGKRISRLDHLEIANELGRRPTYFRSVSGRSETAQEFSSDDDHRSVVEDPPRRVSNKNNNNTSNPRPISHYPHLSSTTSEDQSKRSTMASDAWYDAQEQTRSHEDNYFGFKVPRASSPDPYEPRGNTREVSSALPSLTGSVDSITSSQPRTNTDESTSSRRYDRGLLPPDITSPSTFEKEWNQYQISD